MTTSVSPDDMSRCSPLIGRFPRGLLRLPGVYRPQADTRMLASVAAPVIAPGARVLDACTGTGALAVLAAARGAAEVTAIDVSRRAVFSAWLNGRARGLPVRARRAPFGSAARFAPFDVVLANPPYVPSPRGAISVGRARAWDAGHDGRALLDPLCRRVGGLLAEYGFLLMVHSAVSGVECSLEQLRVGGLSAQVVARCRIPFGPVMRARAGYLERAGLVGPGQREEELVVIRADRW